MVSMTHISKGGALSIVRRLHARAFCLWRSSSEQTQLFQDAVSTGARNPHISVRGQPRTLHLKCRWNCLCDKRSTDCGCGHARDPVRNETRRYCILDAPLKRAHERRAIVVWVVRRRSRKRSDVSITKSRPVGGGGARRMDAQNQPVGLA